MAVRMEQSCYPMLIAKLPTDDPHTRKVAETLMLACLGRTTIDVFTDGWPQYSTILIKPSDVPYLAEIDVVTTDLVRCRQVLLNTDVIDWTLSPRFVGVSPAISRCLTTDICRVKNLRCDLAGPYILLHLRRMCERMGPPMPPNYHFGKLKPSDARLIASVWKNSEDSERSENFIIRLVEEFLTVCIRDENGGLVGWYSEVPWGSLGLLHVLPSHRNLGLGQKLVRQLSMDMLDNGKFPYVHTHAHNHASIKIHQACGYKTVPEDPKDETDIVYDVIFSP